MSQNIPRWTERDLAFIQGNPKVYICMGAQFGLITRLFAELGFSKATSAKDADLIVYGGGADVDPSLYGQKAIDKCGAPDLRRDRIEKEIFETAKVLGTPQLGICRGAQFLHVMNGGNLWQHVNGHTQTHMMYDLLGNHLLRTSSTHHQMMQWNEEMEMIACCDDTIATFLEDGTKLIDFEDGDDPEPQIEVEVASYPDTKTLCVQGHPEYGPMEFTSWFSYMMRDWFQAVSPKFAKTTNKVGVN